MKFLQICIFVASSIVLTNTRRWFLDGPSVAYEYTDSCILNDGTKGVCKQKCNYDVLNICTPYKICYFLGGIPYTCCKETNLKTPATTTSTSTTTPMPSPEPIKQRAADQVCAFPEHHAIVAGEFTAPKEFPYMVALGWQHPFIANVYDYKCGGVLLWNDYVLTAAHCAIVNGVQPDVVLVGGVNLNDTTGDVFKVKRVIIHPEYNSDLIYNDIALLELETSASDKFACLWTQLALDNDLLTAIGYGHVSFGGVGSNRLLKANFNVVLTKECQQFYDSDENLPSGILETQFCAKDPNNRSDTCQGDSGGPLIKYAEVGNNETIKAFVVGITSYGTGCAFSPPGIYTRVSAYVDWIESHVWPNGVSF